MPVSQQDKEMFEKIKADTPPAPEFVGAIESVTVFFTDDNKDAVSDLNAQQWAVEQIAEWGRTPQEPAEVRISTIFMFDCLRVAVKKGVIKNLYVNVDGEVYDFIFPNGKAFGHNMPECLDIRKDVLMSLL